jgi:hypothetical protein
MAYLTYNGQRVISSGKYITNKPIPGQIDLISSGDGVNFSSLPVVTGNQTIKGDMYIKDTNSSFRLFFTSGSNDYLRVYYDLSFEDFTYNFIVEVRQTSLVKRRYNIGAAGLLGVPFSFEIIKGTNSITSVKFNGNTLTDLGPGYLSYGNNPAENKFDGTGNVSLWNLEIVGSHKWIGYPYGNTNAAWVDTIGAINGTITGTPGTINLF